MGDFKKIYDPDFEGKRNLARKSAREKIPALKKKILSLFQRAVAQQTRRTMNGVV